MKIQVGAGNRPLDNYINFDIFPTKDSVLYGSADDLPCSDRSVDILFSNAVFEHLDPSKYQFVFREWDRVLSDQGLILALGIPDFDRVARTYLEGDFSLEQVYNYVVGEILDTGDINNFKAQLHKRLFDINSLEAVFKNFGFCAHSFRYCYPKERHKVCLGVVATRTALTPSAMMQRVGKILETELQEFIQVHSIESVALQGIVDC